MAISPAEAVSRVIELLWIFIKAFYYLILSLLPRKRKSVQNKVILITGAGHGMGRCMAHLFAKEGATLVLWDVNEAGNKKTEREVRELGATVYAYTVDVRKKEVVYETAERVKAEVGRVQLLINNAGILVGELLLELTDDQIQKVMDVNLMGNLWMIRAFLPDMLTEDEGHIVTMSSAAGYYGTPYLVDYSASKFAVTGMDEALEFEIKDVYKKHNIHQTIVHPFIVNTGMVHGYKSRILPEFIREEDAAAAIVDGVLKNERFVFIPNHLGRALFAKFIGEGHRPSHCFLGRKRPVDWTGHYACQKAMALKDVCEETAVPPDVWVEMFTWLLLEKIGNTKLVSNIME